MTAFVCISLLIVTAWLFTASFSFRSVPSNILAFLNYCLGQIVLLSIVLSETFQISRTSFLIGHVLLALVSCLVWIKKGRPPLIGGIALWRKSQLPGGYSFWFTIGFGFLLLVLLGFNFDFYRQMPSMNKDALSYHIPRAYFWLQAGNLHYLPYADFRWTEFPPNSSIFIMWMMAVGIGYEWLHLPQTIGVILIGLSVYRLAMLCGGSRLAASSSTAVVLGFPAALYQMGTSGNDLLVGGLAASYVTFFFQTIAAKSDNVYQVRSSIQAGIAFGLGIGMKYTFLLFLPALFLISLASLPVSGYRIWFRQNVSLVIAGMTAGLILGGYSYIQNFHHYGSFFLSDESKQILQNLDARLYSPARNVVLSFYQGLSWHGIATSPFEWGPTMQRTMIALIDKYFRLGIAELPAFNQDANLTELYTDENKSGYGVVGFLIMVVSPFVALYSMIRYFHAREFSYLVAAGLVGIGLSALIFFCLNAPWGTTQARYLIQFVPFLVPPVLCCLRPEWLNRGVQIICLLFGLWVMTYCLFLESGRQSIVKAIQSGKGAFDLYYGGIWSPQVEVLKKVAKPGRKIGYAGRIDSWVFALPRELPSYKYILVQPGDIREALAAGRVKAVIGELVQQDLELSVPLPGSIFPPRQHIYVPNPTRFLSENLNEYGLLLSPDQKILEMNEYAIESFTEINHRWPLQIQCKAHKNSLNGLLPLGLVSNSTSDLRVEIPFHGDLSTAAIARVDINQSTVPFVVENGKIILTIPQSSLIKGNALQAFRIIFNEDVSLVLKGDREWSDALIMGAPWSISVVP